MAKARVQFVCQNCGAAHTRWAGKCDSCGEWNTLVEEGTSGGIGSGPASMRSARKGRAVTLTTLSGEIEEAPRIVSGIGELDRATGSGFVRGSAPTPRRWSWRPRPMSRTSSRRSPMAGGRTC